MNIHTGSPMTLAADATSHCTQLYNDFQAVETALSDLQTLNLSALDPSGALLTKVNALAAKITTAHDDATSGVMSFAGHLGTTAGSLVSQPSWSGGGPKP